MVPSHPDSHSESRRKVAGRGDPGHLVLSLHVLGGYNTKQLDSSPFTRERAQTSLLLLEKP